MKLLASLISMILLFGATAIAEKRPTADSKPNQYTGQRKYSLIIKEGTDNEKINNYMRGMSTQRGNRSLLSSLSTAYRSTFTGQILTASQGLIELGVNSLVNATRSKRPDWEQAVNNESKFVRVLPMQMEILDFYEQPSTQGPLDPSDIMFKGFGCRQVIEYMLPDSTIKEEEVFYLSCHVDTTDHGLNRMLYHSKFEIYVDSLRFNPWICDLPNDSLGVDNEKRIDFSFDKRKNLKFNIEATITSSWITQAMQVFNNQEIGRFNITADINPDCIDGLGAFTYSSRLDANNPKKHVTVIGDCFLVPRSYVGSTDMRTAQDAWGTGQYKVEMRIAETCQINEKYYDPTDKEKKDAWKEEWKKIKSRKKSKSPWKQVLNIVGTGYIDKDKQWITTLIDPLKTTIIAVESDFLNGSATAVQNAVASGTQKPNGQKKP